MTSFAWGAGAPMFDDRELRRMARQMRLALAALTEEQPTRGGSRGRGRRTGEHWFGAEEAAEYADQRRRGEDPRRASRAAATDQEDARRDADPGRADSPASDEEPDPRTRGEHRGHCGGAWPHHRGFRADFFAEDLVREAWRAQREAWLEQCRAARLAMMAAAEAGASESGARSEESRGPGPEGRAQRQGKASQVPRRAGRGPGRSCGARGAARPLGLRRSARRAPLGRHRWPVRAVRALRTGRRRHGSRPAWPGTRVAVRRGPWPRRPWRHPAGDPGPAERGPATWLSADPRHQRAQRGRLGAEPGIDLPGAVLVAGRGPHRRREGRGPAGVLPDRRRSGVRGRAQRADHRGLRQNSPTSEHEALAEVGKLMWGSARPP